MNSSTNKNQIATQWKLPSISDILDDGRAPVIDENIIQQRAGLIEESLASLGAPAQVVTIGRGPSITQFGVVPLFLERNDGTRAKVRVSEITSLSEDLAIALATRHIRIQALVPGHSYISIEVPNEEAVNVPLRDILESEVFKRNTQPLNFALGRDTSGLPIIASLIDMPHMLIMGAMGTGKSVCVNSIITNLLLSNTPDDLRIVLADPKRLELIGYNDIPHLLGPVIVDINTIIGGMQWILREMDKRHYIFAQVGARNLNNYNTMMKQHGKKKLPHIVIIIDEISYIMDIARNDIIKSLSRIEMAGHTAGIHIIITTQRPELVANFNNFTGLISFAVHSQVNDFEIFNQYGIECLIRPGDMFFQQPGLLTPLRLQGSIVSDHEIQGLVEFWKNQVGRSNAYAVTGTPVSMESTNVPLNQAALWSKGINSNTNQLFDDAVEIVRKERRTSTSMLQRRLRIGYTRASRIMDMMEEQKIVGPPEGGTQMRAVLNRGDSTFSKP